MVSLYLLSLVLMRVPPRGFLAGGCSVRSVQGYYLSGGRGWAACPSTAPSDLRRGTAAAERVQSRRNSQRARFRLRRAQRSDRVAAAYQQFVDCFREASPYIHAHRNRIFVVVLGGEAIASARISSLVHDLALLGSLGIRLVVVHGARPQIDARLERLSIASRWVGDTRVTDKAAMDCVKEAAGAVRVELEALLSQGLANSPMAGARVQVASGNFITARPIGVRDGVDFGFAGTIRRIDSDAIRRSLEFGELVLISPLGYSPTGETFNLNAAEVGTAVAAELSAPKLVFVLRAEGMLDARGKLVRQITQADLQQYLIERGDLDADTRAVLGWAGQACRQGVQRVHLVPLDVDGALLLELFSRDGIGTMVSPMPFDALRPASIDDVGGILELIRPLEEEGTLVRRSREKLEMDIKNFTVIERDGTVIACAALFAFDDSRTGELACVAVHPDYRRAGKAATLYEHIEARARRDGLERLFALTTQAEHWFVEHGFRTAGFEALPIERKGLYNYQRNSKVLIKDLVER
jgi:amino-acid N-acetyltransferase